MEGGTTIEEESTEVSGELLVPIHVNVSVDNQRWEDHFSWNLNESMITPELFARMIVRDEDLPKEFSSAITESIQAQLKSYMDSQLQNTNTAGARLRVLELDLRVGRVVLRDKFEWDIYDNSNSPESFAASLCRDLGLLTEFIPVITNSIRQQVLEERRKLGSAHPLSTTLPGFRTVRSLDDQEDWEPQIEVLTAEELEKAERSQLREARLARRNRGKEHDLSPRSSRRKRGRKFDHRETTAKPSIRAVSPQD